jgi:hypothetical protein
MDENGVVTALQGITSGLGTITNVLQLIEAQLASIGHSLESIKVDLEKMVGGGKPPNMSFFDSSGHGDQGGE